MIKTMLSILCFVAPTMAQAEVNSAPPDIITCLKGVDGLGGLGYRSEMQQLCIVAAEHRCMALERETCVDDVSEAMGIYNKTLVGLLPSTITGSKFQIAGYERAMERAKTDGAPHCSDMGQDNGRMCEFIALSATTINLFYRARQAGVSLP